MGLGYRRGRFRIFACENRGGRRVFSGILRICRPFIPALRHSHLASPSSALKTSMASLKAHAPTGISDYFAAARARYKLGSPLVDDRPIMNAVKYRIVSGMVWNNRTMVSSNTDTSRISDSAVSMEQRRNEKAGGGGTGDSRENPPTNGIVRHDSHMRKSGGTRQGIGPLSPWWEASRLTAQP
ncbi:hypothetical protein PR048_007085 [Dryococelus australis]|uniref:Uncharacterized protein n=1 Tax=Dryococelus australis TaxID=614101 RepID=A0ABQ9ICQ3_9NEOP|nr:hypothetical protein PR048_007085 [Dryococelus australis]